MKLKYILIIVLILCVTTIVDAQPPTFETDVEDAPAASLPLLGGFIAMLVAFGISKFFPKKNK